MKRSLKGLSDKALLAQIQKLRRQEHLSTMDILLHLNEVERRKLHLKLGYGSLFAYCEKHLEYSASAAGRRIQSARCIWRFPAAYELLRRGRVNLMTLSTIAPILTEENHGELLASIRDKTQREAEAIASQYRPPISMRDRVRPVRVRVSKPAPLGQERAASACAGKSAQAPSVFTRAGVTAPTPNVRGCAGMAAQAGSPQLHRANENQTSMSDHSQTGSDILLTHVAKRTSGRRAAHIEKKLLIQFLAGEEFMQKYEEARALLSQRLSNTSFEKVFAALLEEFLERHCPVRRKARRDMKKTTIRKPCRTKSKKETGTAKKSSPAEVSSAAGLPSGLTGKSRSRHVPAAVRDEVFARDNGRCTYIGKTGKRCGSTQALQLDHIEPFARGGGNTAANLRLLCAKHNRLAAEEVFGEGFSKGY